MFGYVETFKSLQRRFPPFSRLVSWRRTLDTDQGILGTKDDGFLRCYAIEGPDLDSLSAEQCWALTLRLNETWKLLPPGAGLWHHRSKRPAPPVVPQSRPSPAGQIMETEHCQALNAEGACWTPTIHLALYYREPNAAASRALTSYLMQGRPAVKRRYGLQAFHQDTQAVIDLLTRLCPDVTPLTRGSLLTYLHSWCSVHDHPIEDDGLGVDLAPATADNCLWRGFVPILGDLSVQQCLRSVVLHRTFPHDTEPRMLRQLEDLRFAYDVVCRWIPKARIEAHKQTDKAQTNWLSSRLSLRQYRHDALTGDRDRIKNSYVDRQADDADLARTSILSGDYDLGRLTVTCLVREPWTRETATTDEARAHEKIGTIASMIRQTGCTVYDDPINQLENYLGCLPGNAYANLDTLEMTSLNLSTLMLWHQPWKGVTWNTHLHSAPLYTATTAGGARVGVETYVQDQGDALLIGPKGSGKSTALALFDHAWLTDDPRALYHFDKGGSCRCVILCLGGEYHDVRSDIAQQVMADVDDDAALPWIFGWLKRRVAESGIPRHPDIETFLWGGLVAPSGLRGHPEIPRTLTNYLYLLQHHANKFSALAGAQRQPRSTELALMTPRVLGALRPFAHGGAYGHLTDAPVDRLKLGRVHGFELSGLLGMSDAYSAILEILFYRLKAKRDGTPTRYVFDEAREYFNTPAWVEILKDEIPDWRKQQASGFFAGQALSQFRGTALSELVIGSTKTRFLFPNSGALDLDVRDAYLGLGMHEEEIRRNIVLAQPQREVYYMRPHTERGEPQRRLIDLSLGPVAAAICGSSTPQDHAAMDDILGTYPREEFPERWLRHKGLPFAAEELRRCRTAS